MTFDFFGFLFGSAGAALLSLNRPTLSRWGFVFYLGSNTAWIIYAFSKGEKWLLMQTTFYALTTIVGVWQYILKPRFAAASRSAMSMLDHDVTSLVFSPPLSYPRVRSNSNARLGKAG